MLEYPELGMEAVWKVDVENFPAFIVVDSKGESPLTEDLEAFGPGRVAVLIIHQSTHLTSTDAVP